MAGAGGDEFDGRYWEQHYRSHGAAAHAEPNPHLVREAADLAPGTALDAGCGEGADALWLAQRGWRVTAVDVSPTVLDRARERAEETGPEVTARIEWLQADLATWSPAEAAFDLVSSHHVHLPAAAQPRLVPALAAAVAPGGLLLVASHHASDLESLPDLDGWEVRVSRMDGRTAGESVLRARRP